MSDKGDSAGTAGFHGPGLRLDKFLWAARFLKSRSLATHLCEQSRVRVSGRVVDKAHALVRVGDVLTFPLGSCIRVVRILALPSRRGPASEAQALYEDLNPGPATAGPTS